MMRWRFSTSAFGTALLLTIVYLSLVRPSASAIIRVYDGSRVTDLGGALMPPAH